MEKELIKEKDYSGLPENKIIEAISAMNSGERIVYFTGKAGDYQHTLLMNLKPFLNRLIETSGAIFVQRKIGNEYIARFQYIIQAR